MSKSEKDSGIFTREETERWEEMKHETFAPLVLSEEEYERLKKEGKI